MGSLADSQMRSFFSQAICYYIHVYMLFGIDDRWKIYLFLELCGRGGVRDIKGCFQAISGGVITSL